MSDERTAEDKAASRVAGTEAFARRKGTNRTLIGKNREGDNVSVGQTPALPEGKKLTGAEAYAHRHPKQTNGAKK